MPSRLAQHNERRALGQEAQRTFDVVDPMLDDQERQVVHEAVTALEAGELTPDAALRAWARIASTRRVRSELKSRIRAGEHASRHIKEEMDRRADPDAKSVHLHT